MDIKPKYTLEEMFLTGFDDNSKCCELACYECAGRGNYDDQQTKCDVVANFEIILYDLRICNYGDRAEWKH